MKLTIQLKEATGLNDYEIIAQETIDFDYPNDNKLERVMQWFNELKDKRSEFLLDKVPF
jgi:hypothetical protein